MPFPGATCPVTTLGFVGDIPYVPGIEMLNALFETLPSASDSRMAGSQGFVPSTHDVQTFIQSLVGWHLIQRAAQATEGHLMMTGMLPFILLWSVWD